MMIEFPVDQSIRLVSQCFDPSVSCDGYLMEIDLELPIWFTEINTNVGLACLQCQLEVCRHKRITFDTPARIFKFVNVIANYHKRHDGLLF